MSLSSSDPAITVPATVTIPAGANYVNFTMNSTAVPSNRVVTVSATLDGKTLTERVIVTP